MESTVDYASTHLAQLLTLVGGGEEVLLREGSVAVAKIVPIGRGQAAKNSRPKVGTITSGPIRWTPESFAALDENGMRELGLL